jgi:hypothetical protein
MGRLLEKLKPTEKENIYIFSVHIHILVLYFSISQCTRLQPISVADLD